eukprot:3126428-Amphidinium_carterae.1
MHVQQEDGTVGTVEIHQNHYQDTVVAPSHDKLKWARDHADKELQGSGLQQVSHIVRSNLLVGSVTTRSSSDYSISPGNCSKTTREASTASSVTS